MLNNEIVIRCCFRLLHNDFIGIIDAFGAEAENMHVTAILRNLNDVVDFLQN